MALPYARPVSDHQKIMDATAAASQVPGDIISAYAGKAGVVLGTENKLNGDDMALALDGLWEVDCASGTTAAAGAKAYFHLTNKVIVTSATGAVQCGLFARAKASGELKALIDLNAIALS